MLKIGEMNDLVVAGKVEFGLYLDAGEYGDILLPARYVPKEWEIGQPLTVFVYTDSEDRLIATTETPLAKVGEFASLKVVSNTDIGAFLDWGLAKDLFLPLGEQKRAVYPGQSNIVRVFLDTETGRVAASARLNQFLDQTEPKYEEGEEVNLLITNKTDIGYRAIVNNAHWGVIFENDASDRLIMGTTMKGYIKRIRSDKKIDLVLRRFGIKKSEDLSEIIMQKLEAEGGFLPLTDKTDPAILYQMFGVSKKMYKRAVGGLYRERRIVIEENGIRKVKSKGEQ